MYVDLLYNVSAVVAKLCPECDGELEEYNACLRLSLR